ncbi:MAG: PqqD family protein [Candidatus Omnitrophota bacterium]
MDILKAIPVKNKNIAWRTINGETVIVILDKNPSEKESLYNLNQTATKIWLLVNGRNSVKEIVDKILDTYEVNDAEAESQVKHILKTLFKAAALDFIEK